MAFKPCSVHQKLELVKIMTKYYVGGQALIEGVMMKYKDNIAIAVRKKNGKIAVKKEKLKIKDSKIPFWRGIINLFVILYIGIKALNYSSNMQLGKEEKISTKEMVFSIAFAVILAIVLFKFLPLLLTTIINRAANVNNILFNFIDGIIKIVLFVGYIYLISLNKEVYRVFQYHGAEHKAVACHENKKKLTVEETQKFSTIHKRCGTTFVFLVLFISIIVYLFIPKNYNFATKLGLRIILLPVIASISYEILRLGARFSFLKALILPGLLIQKITTKEPDNKQVQVAIKALKAAVDHA